MLCACLAVDMGEGPGEAEVMDWLYLQHIFPTAASEVDPDPGDDDNDGTVFPKLYEARSAPCSIFPASIASWSPGQRT